ncbi:MAG TPA: YciI family protein [Longimicrobiales bacterium]
MTPTYLLLVRDTTPEVYEGLSAEERRHLLNQWNGWCDRLAAAGLEAGHPLDNGGRVVSGARGERVVDGPFSEAKELVGGFFLLTIPSLDDVTELARQCPLLPWGMTVEIRPVIDACHLATSLGMSTMRESDESAAA